MDESALKGEQILLQEEKEREAAGRRNSFWNYVDIRYLVYRVASDDMYVKVECQKLIEEYEALTTENMEIELGRVTPAAHEVMKGRDPDGFVPHKIGSLVFVSDVNLQENTCRIETVERHSRWTIGRIPYDLIEIICR